MGVEARRGHKRGGGDPLTETSSSSALRRVESREEVDAAVTLAWEYGQWMVQVAKREYGIDAEAESEQGLGSSIDQLLAPRGRLYLVEVDGVPVGLGGLKPVSDEIAEIKRIYLRPSARGHGLGRQLLDQLLTDARELGVKLVRLESAAFMPEARSLYRSVGFKEVPAFSGEFAAIPGAQEIQVFMALCLDNAEETPDTA